MKYMLLIYGDENAWTPAEREDCMQTSAKLCETLAEKGYYRGASPLHSVTTATSLQIRNGKPLITDGPFAETREQLGGYYLIDVPNLDIALDIAAQIPGAQKGTVEVRPIFELDGLPTIPA